MRVLSIGGVILSSFLYAFPAATDLSQIRETGPGRFEWLIEFPESNAISFTETGVEFQGWNGTVNQAGLTVPVISKLIFTESGPPQISINVDRYRVIESPKQLFSALEQSKGADYTVSPRLDADLERLVSTKLIRSEADHQLWAINVIGARPPVNKTQFRIPEQLSLTITTDLLSYEKPADKTLYMNQVRESVSNSIKTSSSSLELSQGKMKLQVLEDGIYRITYNLLAAVEDFPSDAIESQSLRLFNKGEEQPIYVSDGGDGIFDEGDYFDFIGRQNYNSTTSQYFDPFSDINIYWLDWGNGLGLRFVEESGSLAYSNPVRPVSFWDETHIEEDLLFDRLGQVDTDLPTTTRDHYFWVSVNSGQNKEVNFFLADPFRGSSENVEVSIGLHGLTYSQGGEGGKHSVFASINDNYVGVGDWSQQEEFTLISQSALNLPHSILAASGSNTLALLAPPIVQAGVYDRIVLNWVKIGYEHLLKAHDDFLRFRKSHINPATNLEFEVRGFTSPNLVLYKEGLSKITGYSIREIYDSNNPSYNLVFQDQATTATPDYWVSTVETMLRPVDIVVDTLGDLRNLDGDFIILTVPEFTAGLEAYVNFKQDQGWNPVVVSLMDVYDEFNYGIKSPYAIKSFLKYANNNWPSQPEYVMFVGDAIADPQQAKRDVRLKNIPTFYMQTYAWGAAEADFWYSIINGNDYIPDLKIGRLPCNDQADLQNTLNKLIRYDTDLGYGSWQNEIITIAGFETTFKHQSQSLLKNEVPRSFMPSRVFIDRTSEGQLFWGDTDSLIDLWNDGKLLINFLGHGGGAVWADRSLFVREDIDFLDSEAPPAFVTSMTCFTSSFAQIQGLGEVVLTKSPAGAIGWYGSSGVGWMINDYLMIQPMLRRLLEEHKTVGELINTARTEYFVANSGYDYLKPSMLFQYNYLGDPTTRLALPESAELLTASKDIYSRTDQLELNYVGNEAGTLSLLPVNADGVPWWQEASTYETALIDHYLLDQEAIVYNADSTAIITPPAGESRTIYTFDRGPDKPAIQGYVPYSITADWFEHRTPTADELQTSTDIRLRLRYHSNISVPDSIILSIVGGNSLDEQLVFDGEWWNSSSLSGLRSGNINTYYFFTAYENDTDILHSAVFRLYLPSEISLSLNAVHEGTRGKLCGLEYEYTLEGLNQGTAILNHYDSSAAFQQQIITDVELEKGNNTLFIPSFMGSGDIQVRSSLHLSQDATPEDDTLRIILSPSFYQVIPGLGVSFDGQSRDTIALWSNGTLLASDDDTSWVRVRVDENEVNNTNGISFYKDSTVYLIESFHPETAVRITAPRSLFFKHPYINAWQILDEVDASYSLRESGLVAMGVKENTTGPRVSLMLEGQLFFDGDYILKNSRLDLLAEDPDGFTWKDDDVSILVDGSPLVIQLGDTSKAAQEMGVTANIDLQTGKHQISYRVSDALGNWSDEETVTAVVAGAAEIIDYGNFPNPFAGETLIIYELTQPLTDVVIDIYTLAGYKLHRIDAFNARVGIPLGAIGYHEVPWNGRDQNEKFVANGVYFYRIRGELNGEELLGTVGKMVKNR